jgi:thiosulfate/3-mercaptopyruvate sulfurtransferase
MSARDEVLITATELRRLLDAGAPVTLLDVRWQLGEPDGRPAFEQGHLPGAVYVSLEDELSDHSVTGRGRHPLPSGAALQDAARRCGIRDGVPVVAYDDWNRAGSARAWWVLTAAGIPDVRILDGGLSAWTAVGGALETGTVVPAPGDVEVRHRDLHAGARPTVSVDGVSAAGTLVDARAPERFRGDVEPTFPARSTCRAPACWPATAPCGPTRT